MHHFVFVAGIDSIEDLLTPRTANVRNHRSRRPRAERAEVLPSSPMKTKLLEKANAMATKGKGTTKKGKKKEEKNHSTEEMREQVASASTVVASDDEAYPHVALDRNPDVGDFAR